MTLLNELGELPATDLADVNKLINILQAKMGEESYQREFEIGRSIQMAEAIEIALA